MKLLSLLLLTLLFVACGDDSSSPSEETAVIPKKEHGILVFRDDDSGHLKMIEYKNGWTNVDIADEMVVDLVDFESCYHPEISPDGKWVAYATTFESSGEMSSIYVKKLFSTEKPVLLEVPIAAVPRWKVMANGDTNIVYVDNTSLNEGPNWNNFGTWKVPFMNGAFGEPEKLFPGTFNGGISDDMTYMVGGASLLMSRYLTYDNDTLVSYVDSVWYDSAQTCNASLAKDGSKRTLFLDMAGRQGVEFVGEKYRPHQQILVIDSLGKLIDAVPSPKNTAFDHTEWVGEKELVVATLQDANLLHTKIILVDMSDSSIVELVSGGELWHPSLWIEK